MAPKIGKGGQIWLKCIIRDLIMMIRDKNNILRGLRKFMQKWHGITPIVSE